jgi:hypothetical protein
MSAINTSKVIVGGLVAGLVFCAVDFVVFNYVLGAQMHAELGAISDQLVLFIDAKRAIVGGIGVDFLLGVSAIWIYAAIRPRFGAGPRTALLAGAATWFIAALAYSSYYLNRMFSLELFCLLSLIELVSVVIGTMAGAKLYTEGDAAVTR